MPPRAPRILPFVLAMLGCTPTAAPVTPTDVPTAAYVAIPGGSFEGLGVTRAIAAFELMRTEVTVAQYRACVEARACRRPHRIKERKWQWWPFNWERPGRDQHPVNGVSWHDATAYCTWVGARLPTEWEWEWAARGREQARTYPWGDEPPTMARVNLCDSRCILAKRRGFDGWEPGGDALGTEPVGSRPAGASRDGVEDLAGNVWEWTASASERLEGSRVLRGDGWRYSRDASLRTDYRRAFSPDHKRDDQSGFRCARSP